MQRFTAVVVLAISMCACVTTQRSSSRTGVAVVERCPPAHHYEAGAGCVHNGNAKGHYK